MMSTAAPRQPKPQEITDMQRIPRQQKLFECHSLDPLAKTESNKRNPSRPLIKNDVNSCPKTTQPQEITDMQHIPRQQKLFGCHSLDPLGTSQTQSKFRSPHENNLQDYESWLC
ncbi:hypothetical protein JTE90_002876 [Oedothorax gibbosus]|uniref:Prolactin receptor n=1 Tax=Oedothorax gibbosus TaxID=931172 RepID=A0AAV6VCJ2_9ARAC|nr:hypothetical protein JTE90_002876 [Oedothorax gibbosus]